ncbi:hypothetical protein P4C99_04550 [Pontiellaceae bacterium B1224]|nr:hypothetical protein [Pontiellaceae bacterium B1224]
MELHYSNRNAFLKTLPEVLEHFYNAATLWEICCEQIYPLVEEPQPDKKPKKAILIELLLEVLSNDESLETLLKSMPEEVYTALNNMIWAGDQEVEALESDLGFEITNKKTVQPRYHYEHETVHVSLKPGYWWLALEVKSSYSYRSDGRVIVRLPPAVRSRFKECMPRPHGYDFEPLASPPEGFKIYRCDDALAEDLRIVSDYISRGHLEYTKAEAIKKPCIRALEKLTEGGEFFPGEKSSTKLPLLRHELLANIVASTGESLREAMLEEPPDPEKLLRPLCSALFRHPEWFLEYVLTHLSGGSVYHGKEAVGYLKALFSRLSDEHWISMQNLESYVNYRELDINPVSCHRCFVNIEPYMEDYYRHSRIEVDRSNGWDLIIVPLLKGTSFMLAALGLAEIAYSAPPRHPKWTRKSEIFLTPYDGCAAIRLTPLGAYAFGLTDEVELKVSQHARPEILLNPQRLTAICRNIDPITELSLLEFMEKVSDGCYRMTRQTLLRGCSTSKDVAKRVEQFKAQISDNLPDLWVNFLDSAIETAGALRPKTRYTVYELADNPELRRLFISDPILSEKALKVEGMRVAIEKADVVAISKRLNALGYLMK